VKNGIECNLVHTLPQRGIVVSHRDFVTDLTETVSQNILLICIKADRDVLNTADIHIVQNRSDPTHLCNVLNNNRHFIHYWPQEKLVPRDESRQGLLCNVAYFGREWNLEPILQQPLWKKTLKEMGLNWFIIPPERWNDYSEVDVVIAIRKFNSTDTYNDKPASKLVNSWKGSVPALLGCESAYRYERKSELDYLEVRTIDDVLNALYFLKNNKSVFLQMIENGKRRARDLTSEKIVKEWEFFLKNVAIPQYYLKFEQLSL
jgi:hypothetical protein